MADFVRFRLIDGAPVLVNTERITCVTKHFKGRDKDREAIWSGEQTDISFGDEDADVAVNEPFEQVCDKLTDGGKPETGPWVFEERRGSLKTDEDEETDPYGIF